MAVPYRDEDSAKVETKAFALAESYYKLSQLDAWKDLLERIQELVNKAEDDLFKDRSSEDGPLMLRTTTWQQRRLFQQVIKGIVDSELDIREQFLEERKQGESDEHSTVE